MKKSKVTPLPVGQNDKVLIDEQYTGEERVEMICNNCSCTLSKLTDAGHNNITWWCGRCQIAFDPHDNTIRHRHRLTVPEENETAIAHPPGQEYLNKQVEVRHPKELRGGIAELQKRGLKITYFDDSSQR